MRTVLLRAGAEYTGTFVLATVTYSAIQVGAMTGMLSLAIALLFGGSLAVLIGVLGRFSGAHLNPAVTLFFTLIRHLAWRDVPVYLVSQLLGGITSAWLLHTLFGSVIIDTDSLSLGPWISLLFGVGTTTVFLLVVFLSASDERPQGQVGLTGWFAALVVGLIASLCTLGGGVLINPAQSLMLVLLIGREHAQLGPLFAPFVGTVVAAGLYWGLRHFGASPAKGYVASEFPLPSRNGVSSLVTPQDMEAWLTKCSCGAEHEKRSKEVTLAVLLVPPQASLIFSSTTTRSTSIFWVYTLSSHTLFVSIVPGRS